MDSGARWGVGLAFTKLPTIGVSVAFPKLQLYHLYNEDVTQLNHTTGKKEIIEQQSFYED